MTPIPIEVSNDRPASQPSTWKMSNAKTSRAALMRTNTATFESVMRMPTFAVGKGGLSSPEAALPSGLNRTNSTVFGFVSKTNNDKLLQRASTFVPRQLQRTDSLWNTTNPELPETSASINGRDLEEVGANALRIFYQSDWCPVTIHYSLDNEATWTVPPGVMMIEAQGMSLPDLSPSTSDVKAGHRLFVLTLPEAPNGISFVPNANGAAWDNTPNGQNYRINGPGTYFLKCGDIKRLCYPPGRPIILVEKRIEVQEIELSWNPPIEGEADVAGYKVYRNDEMIGTLDLADALLKQSSQETVVNRCFEGYRIFTDTALMGNTRYRYHVTAYNDNGDEGKPSSPLVLHTSTPDKPGKIMSIWIDRTSTDFIDLAWEMPCDTGGGTVEAFRIFKNGAPIAIVPVPGTGPFHYRDSDVITNQPYCYHVTAALSKSTLQRNGPMNPIMLDDSDERVLKKATDTMLKMDDDTLDALRHGIIDSLNKQEGHPSDGVIGEARKQMELPKLFEKKSHILLQSFNWRSCHNKLAWYKVLAAKVPQMAELGVSLLWLPPPSQSVAPQGYMPSKLYTLDSAYGSEQLLRKLIRECEDYMISPMLDFVANHRCGSKQDDLGQWTIFEDPAWGPWAIVSNNKQGYKNVSNETDSGAQSDCAPDINHNNPQVAADYKKWLMFLFNDIGFKAIRLDMAPGYGVHHQLNYINTVETPLTIGEYWSGDINALKNYIHKAQKKIAVYDFAFYYVIRRAVEGGDYSEIRNHQGVLNGLVGTEPGLSVTFLDNHDTEHLDFVGKFAGGDAKKLMIGYAILLTHPGIPSVYWNHFSDYGDHMTNALTELGKARREAGITSTSKISIEKAQWDGYVAYITGDGAKDGKTRSLCVKIGHSDGFNPSQGWNHRCHGDGWNVWIK